MSSKRHPAKGPSRPSQLSKNVVPLGLGRGTAVVEGTGDVVEVGVSGGRAGAGGGLPVDGADPPGTGVAGSTPRDEVGGPGALGVAVASDGTEVAGVPEMTGAVDGAGVVDEAEAADSAPGPPSVLVGS